MEILPGTRRVVPNRYYLSSQMHLCDYIRPSGCRLQGLGFRIRGTGFGFRVYGLHSRSHSIPPSFPPVPVTSSLRQVSVLYPAPRLNIRCACTRPPCCRCCCHHCPLCYSCCFSCNGCVLHAWLQCKSSISHTSYCSNGSSRRWGSRRRRSGRT